MPEFVFEATNELIGEKWDADTRYAAVTIDELADRIREKLERDFPDTVMKEEWLDIELPYRLAGWKVTLVNTGWNNPHPNYFTFTK